MLGWAAATWWWPYVLSFYDYPRPKTAHELNEYLRPQFEAMQAQWRRDGGP